MVVDEQTTGPPANDAVSFEVLADPYWDKLRQYKLTNDEAYELAKKNYVKWVGGTRCWMTVVKFDEAAIAQVVRTFLDTTTGPNGNLTPSLKDTNKLAALSDDQRAYILKHEQGHMDISALFAKVLRAELKSMRYVVWSPVPKLAAPDVYRDLAAKLLRQQAKLRLKPLGKLNDQAQIRYDDQTKSGNKGNPHPQQPLWDATIGFGLLVPEGDPNSILFLPP